MQIIFHWNPNISPILIKKNKWQAQVKSFSSGEGENGFSSSFEFVELILSPWLGFGGVIFETADGSGPVTALLNMALISLIDVVMERILKGKGVGLVGALDFNGDGTDDCFVWTPWVGDQSGCVEKAGSNNVGLEILLNSAFFHGPSNNLNGGIRFVSDLDLMESVIGPVVSLLNVPRVKVVVDVIVMAEVVCWVEVCGSH